MSEPNRYAMRLPFQLPENQQLVPASLPVQRRCGDLEVSLSAEANWYSVKLLNLPDEATATGFLQKVRAGLYWATLQNDISPAISLELQSIRYFENPHAAARNIFRSDQPPVDRVDALIDPSRPAVYDMTKSISSLGGMDLRLLMGVQPLKVVDSICEALRLPRPERVVETGKLRVSLDLYGAYFRETSPNAKFLTLALALEALLPEELRSNDALTMVERWIAEVEQAKTTASNPALKAELDSLEGGLRFQRSKSISAKVRDLVEDALLRLGDTNAAKEARRAVQIYGDRSKLVHKGYLPPDHLSEATADLKDILRKVLSVQFREAASE
jgi:hypothetical protein